MLDDIEFDNLMEVIKIAADIPVLFVFKDGHWEYDGVEIVF